jgi:hypothetical protein
VVSRFLENDPSALLRLVNPNWKARLSASTLSD